jgi:uncharacterized protein YigA (DUF484 family)
MLTQKARQAAAAAGGVAEAAAGEDAGAQHRAAPASGLLLLASEDPQRFYSGMGTLFLERLGELISAVLGGAPVSLSGTTAAAT